MTVSSEEPGEQAQRNMSSHYEISNSWHLLPFAFSAFQDFSTTKYGSFFEHSSIDKYLSVRSVMDEIIPVVFQRYRIEYWENVDISFRFWLWSLQTRMPTRGAKSTKRFGKNTKQLTKRSLRPWWKAFGCSVEGISVRTSTESSVIFIFWFLRLTPTVMKSSNASIHLNYSRRWLWIGN